MSPKGSVYVYAGVEHYNWATTLVSAQKEKLTVSWGIYLKLN